MCVTRWVEKYHSLKGFQNNLVSIIKSLEFIAAKKYDNSTTSAALMLRNSLEDSSLIITLVVTRKLIEQTQNLTLYLQSKSLDLSKALELVLKIITEFEEMKTNDFFDTAFQEGTDLCREMGIFVTLNRNFSDWNKKKYYRERYFLPILDAFINDLTSRSSKAERNFSKLSKLLNSNVDLEMDFFQEIANSFGNVIGNRYDEDLSTQISLQYRRAEINGKSMSEALYLTKISIQSYIACSKFMPQYQ